MGVAAPLAPVEESRERATAARAKQRCEACGHTWSPHVTGHSCLMTGTIDRLIDNVLMVDRHASPGPWHRGKGLHWGRDVRTADNDSRAWCGSNDGQASDDAALIALYRTAAPALAREVQRLRAEMERRLPVVASEP